MAAPCSNALQSHLLRYLTLEGQSPSSLCSNHKVRGCDLLHRKTNGRVLRSSFVSPNQGFFSSGLNRNSMETSKKIESVGGRTPKSTTTQLTTFDDVNSGSSNGSVTIFETNEPESLLQAELQPGASAGDIPHFVCTSESSVATKVVHGGERRGRPSFNDCLTTPVAMTSTYFFEDTAQLIAFLEGSHKSFEYGRYGNPTTRTVEEKISQIEGAEDTLLSASGMCSATTMLLALVPPGGHIITTTDCYRRTRQFIQTMLPKMGITTTVIDPSDGKALEDALNTHNVSLFFSESPTNPYLRCIDIEYVSRLCHAKNTLVCIDSTFSTPVNQRPLQFGADLVLHSATKYYAGHNDVLAGCISGKKKLVDEIRGLHNVLGGVLDPHAAYLILRGIKTLDLRVQRQNETAMKLARILEGHPKVVRVHYPGLPSHSEHEIAKRQMNGFGGVVSFEIDGDLNKTSQFIDGLKIPYIAPSLGGCESLVEQPTIISYWDYGPEARAQFGIKDNLVRFSVGIESAEDIILDVLQSLERI